MQLKAWVAIALTIDALPGKAAAAANDSAAADLAWKLTLGRYAYAGYSGSDVNLL